MSDDQQHGLTLIAFVGSVFSRITAGRTVRVGAIPKTIVRSMWPSMVAVHDAGP